MLSWLPAICLMHIVKGCVEYLGVFSTLKEIQYVLRDICRHTMLCVSSIHDLGSKVHGTISVPFDVP